MLDYGTCSEILLAEPNAACEISITYIVLSSYLAIYPGSCLTTIVCGDTFKSVDTVNVSDLARGVVMFIYAVFRQLRQYIKRSYRFSASVMYELRK